MEYTNSQIRDLINEYIHSIRDRQILFDRLIDGMVFEAIAEKHELSPRQVRNIVYKNEEILFRKLK